MLEIQCFVQWSTGWFFVTPNVIISFIYVAINMIIDRIANDKTIC